MISLSMEDVLQLAALVSAYVGIAKKWGVSDQYAPLVALGIASVFVLVPPYIFEKILMISVIGLTATGAYHWMKPTSKPDDTGKGTDVMNGRNRGGSG